MSNCNIAQPYNQGPNTSRGGYESVGTHYVIGTIGVKRGRRVELATRRIALASHAPQIRPKIAAILACNIVTALSQCRHVRL